MNLAGFVDDNNDGIEVVINDGDSYDNSDNKNQNEEDNNDCNDDKNHYDLDITSVVMLKHSVSDSEKISWKKGTGWYTTLRT